MAAIKRNVHHTEAYRGLLLTLPLILFGLVFILFPVLGLVREVFVSSKGSAFSQIWTQHVFRTAMINSLVLSISVSLSAVILAFIPAWYLSREETRARSLVRMGISLPLTFSGVMVGFLFVVLLGRVGVIPTLALFLSGKGLFTGLAYTLPGLFLAYLYFEVPRAIMTLEPAFRRFPVELIDTARTLGAGPWTRLFRIIIPLFWSPVRSALAVAFSTSMGSFGVALILARKFSVASLEVYTQLTGFLNDDLAGAFCLILAGMTFGVDRLLSGREP